MHLEELYRAVWENPEDDATRLVLADALVEAGDPRGDLIQLQFANKHDESGAMRLLQRHGMTWLGALRGKVIPIAYEKGFLASCVVTDAEGARGCVELATVRAIELQDARDAPLLADPMLRSLRAIERAEPEVLAAVLAMPIAARLARITATEAPSLVEHYAALAALPALHAAHADAFVLTRAADGRLSLLATRWSEGLVALLEPLPIGALTTVTIAIGTLLEYRQTIGESPTPAERVAITDALAPHATEVAFVRDPTLFVNRRR